MLHGVLATAIEHVVYLEASTKPTPPQKGKLTSAYLGAQDKWVAQRGCLACGTDCYG